MAKVVAYTVDYCPYCKKAKALFNQKGIDFEDIDITDNEDEMREKLEKILGMVGISHRFTPNLGPTLGMG